VLAAVFAWQLPHRLAAGRAVAALAGRYWPGLLQVEAGGQEQEQQEQQEEGQPGTAGAAAGAPAAARAGSLPPRLLRCLQLFCKIIAAGPGPGPADADAAPPQVQELAADRQLSMLLLRVASEAAGAAAWDVAEVAAEALACLWRWRGAAPAQVVPKGRVPAAAAELCGTLLRCTAPPALPPPQGPAGLQVHQAVTGSVHLNWQGSGQSAQQSAACSGCALALSRLAAADQWAVAAPLERLGVVGALLQRTAAAAAAAAEGRLAAAGGVAAHGAGAAMPQHLQKPGLETAALLSWLTSPPLRLLRELLRSLCLLSEHFSAQLHAAGAMRLLQELLQVGRAGLGLSPAAPSVVRVCVYVFGAVAPRPRRRASGRSCVSSRVCCTPPACLLACLWAQVSPTGAGWWTGCSAHCSGACLAAAAAGRAATAIARAAGRGRRAAQHGTRGGAAGLGRGGLARQGGGRGGGRPGPRVPQGAGGQVQGPARGASGTLPGAARVSCRCCCS
jgi:hypothetical protein